MTNLHGPDQIARSPAPSPLAAALDSLKDDSGQSLRLISDARPTLLLLLRHAGCTFCRQTLSDLAHAQPAITSRGLNIAVIGMTPSTKPLRLLGDRLGLTNVLWIADPNRLAYKALNIGRATFRQLFAPRVLLSGLRATLRGHLLGRIQGDPFQMPGTAIIHRGQVVRQWIHETAADRPDLEGLACALETDAPHPSRA